MAKKPYEATVAYHKTADGHWLVIETQLDEKDEELAHHIHETFIDFCEKEAKNIISCNENLMRFRPNPRMVDGWSWHFEARVYQPIGTDLWFKLCEDIARISLRFSIPLKVAYRRFYDIRIVEGENELQR